MKSHHQRRRHLPFLFLALSAGVVVHASQHIFSVHDDLLAYPQYKIVFSNTFILEADAEKLLTSSSSPTSHSDAPPLADSTDTPSDDNDPLSHLPSLPTSNNPPPSSADPSSTTDNPTPTYELMHLHQSHYLCTIPRIVSSPKNATAEALAQASEEKELARASVRGRELLEGMHGTCLYFVYGWWSYKFCSDAGVKQFHSVLSQQGGMVTWPPVEDESVPAYILGRVLPSSSSDSTSVEKHGDKKGEVANKKKKGRRSGDEAEHEKEGKDEGTMEVAIKGDQRYLIQRLGSGTICDLTGKERRIEIEYHCHPSSNGDRIAWIKEVTTCSYLMVVYTPRLCNDQAFLPPKTGANEISCQRVVKIREEGKQLDGEREREGDAVPLVHGQQTPNEKAATKQPNEQKKSENEKRKIIIGGIEVGGRNFFTGRDDARRIEAGNGPESNSNPGGGDGTKGHAGGGSEKGGSKGGNTPKVAANKETKGKKGDVEKSLEAMQKFKKELEDLADQKGWKVEIVQMDDDDDDVHGTGNGKGMDGKKKKKEKNDGVDKSGKQRKMMKKSKQDDNAGERGGVRATDEDGEVDTEEIERSGDSEKGSEEVYILDGL